MIKKFLSYLPARLVKCPSRWYIIFYQIDPSDGLRKKFIKTFDLNRIPDLRIRERVAKEIISKINNLFLPAGWPYVEIDEEEYNQLLDTPLNEAVTFVVKLINANTDRYNSQRTYNSRRQVFLDWLAIHHRNCTIGKFNSRLAVEYFDYLVVEREIGNNTYNNYLRDMKHIFNTIASRYDVNGNPFDGIKKKRKTEKKRRAFTAAERTIIATHIKETDYWLFIAILLLYYCFIRGSELRRLKFSMFNLESGLVIIPASDTKSRRKYIKTIPKSIMPFLLDKKFSGQPTNYLVFGEGMRPNASIKMSRGRFYKRHKAVLKKLLAEKKLKNIEGLSFYSWKDTGATDHMRNIAPQYIKDQMDHMDMSTTMVYRETDLVNPAFEKLPFNLIEQ